MPVPCLVSRQVQWLQWLLLPGLILHPVTHSTQETKDLILLASSVVHLLHLMKHEIASHPPLSLLCAHMMERRRQQWTSLSKHPTQNANEDERNFPKFPRQITHVATFERTNLGVDQFRPRVVHVSATYCGVCTDRQASAKMTDATGPGWDTVEEDYYYMALLCCSQH